MTADLVQFLRDRHDEDAAVADAAQHEGDTQDGRWFDDEDEEVIDDSAWRIAFTKSPAFRSHIARQDQAHTLREVEAKRALLTEYEASAGSPDMFDVGRADGLGVALQHLAAVYADHPDYLPEWRP